MIKKAVAIINAVLTVAFSVTPLSGIFTGRGAVEHRYIIIQDADRQPTLDLLKTLYGENNPENEYLYAMGVCGPLLLTDSPEVIARKTENAFELAERNNVPVWFQFDDLNNQYYAYAGADYPTCEKWYENPENVEKLAFGENAAPATYWFNWDRWQSTPATPCFNSPGFVAFIKNQLEAGFIPVLKKHLARLKAENKEYLFAGVSVGWETHIPDFSGLPDDITDQNNVRIRPEEIGCTGYRALENLGYTREKLDAEAKARHISAERLRYTLLCGVVHDYSEMIAKEIFDAGVEKTKIFTHFILDTSTFETEKNMSYASPAVSAAVNDYSTPGFTFNSNTAFGKMAAMKRKIAKADPSQEYFGAVEGYAAGLNESEKSTLRYFNRLFNSGALVVAVYGIHDRSGSIYEVPKTTDAPFNKAINKLLHP